MVVALTKAIFLDREARVGTRSLSSIWYCVGEPRAFKGRRSRRCGTPP